MEMDRKTSAEISCSAGEESDVSTYARPIQVDKVDEGNVSIEEEKTPSVSVSASASNLGSGSTLVQGEETVSKSDDLVVNVSSSKVDRRRKSSTHLNNSSGKRKVKVDWTPELHKKFVQAVEQLGLDKAVPSKILELMGIDCLTRHNVASHLQKYRSHRKHLLAREAEAATWSRRRQVYRTTTGRTGKTDANSWVVPTTGFPPVTSTPHSRPLHVWGHPSADQSLAYIWPGHAAASPAPPGCVPGHPWPPPQSGDPSFWYYHQQNVPAPGMPCYPLHFPPTSFSNPPVPGVSPSPMYRVAPSIGVPVPPNVQTPSEPPFDSHLSKESIDAVIGDVLSKPWLPLPLGLKPPSIDSVIMELQHQGISKIPPSCA